jgi:predicted GIY-YIG superfamily endonuclease
MQNLPGKEPGTVFIYALKDPNGHIRYVGKTINPRQRMIRHLSTWGNTTHKGFWIRKLLQEGLKPTMVILERVTNEKWRQAETRWIRRLRRAGFDLTNSTEGGDGAGRPRTPDERQRISKALTGRQRSATTRAKIAATLTGHTVSETTRALLRARQLGRTASEETRKRISEANRRRWACLDAASRLAVVARRRKPVWTPEMRAALGAVKRSLHPDAGVRFNAKTQKWQAEITKAGVRRHLGSFPTREAALAARRAAL